MSTNRKLRLVMAALILCGASGCEPGSSDNPVCTQIGCRDGLTVELASRPATAYRIEVFASAQAVAPVFSFDCADPSRCTGEVFVEGFTADHASVRVTTGQGTLTTPVTGITYLHFRPNGANCPPLCRQARVQVPLPG